jgi:DNA-binding MurR/RpiR family transcriptional regulator
MDVATIVEKMTEAYAQMIIESGRFLDAGDLERVARAMLASRQVRIFGMGGSGAVARYLQEKLRSMGVPAIAFRDPREAVIDMANAATGDVFVVISQSGVAEDADHVLAEAIARDALTVALTSDPGSSIGARVDVVLRSVARGLTSRQTGKALGIAESTVRTHIKSIYSKLGVGRRSEIAAWVTALDAGG